MDVGPGLHFGLKPEMVFGAFRVNDFGLAIDRTGNPFEVVAILYG